MEDIIGISKIKNMSSDWMSYMKPSDRYRYNVL